MAFDRQFQNVLLLSVSFMLVFTAFQTMGNIEATVLSSITKDDSSFTGKGYTSLSIIYFVFAASNWLAPSVVAVIKAKWTMVIGGVLYTAFIASFLYPLTWLLYGMSAILGFGAALMWTAQGSYLTTCSNQETMSRNSGVFWAILQCSMFFGNSFVSWQFAGKEHIDQGTRSLVFSVLTGVAIIGVICLVLLRVPHSYVDPSIPAQYQEEDGPLSAFVKAIKLVCRKEMLLLFLTFFYTGIELSFFSGVYSTSIGNTQKLGEEAKRLVGLCGILVGVGEVLGGAIFGLMGNRTIKKGRDPIILLGFLSHTLAFYLIFINIPDGAPLDNTNELSYLVPPSSWVALLCAFLLGFGDSCFNTQLYSILGSLFPEESAPAFALFKFTQSTAAGASFFYSNVLSLRKQLVILQTFCLLGSSTFCIVEWEITKKRVKAEVVTSAQDDEEYQ